VGAAAAPQPKFEVDEGAPSTSVQVRLADGTRLVTRMNLSHTVGDIRSFVDACVLPLTMCAYCQATSCRAAEIQTEQPGRPLSNTFFDAAP
jgi:hypothetical protein